jgi:hypothetical protein
MTLKFALAGILVAGFAIPALAIGANETYYIAHDMNSKKCSVTRENPTTGEVSTGENFESEAAAKAAMDKVADCAEKYTRNVV